MHRIGGKGHRLQVVASIDPHKEVSMRKRDLASALLEGIEEANIDYQDLSGGSWLCDYGAESFLVCHLLKKGLSVARESSSKACATMEQSFMDIAKCSGANKKRGPLPAVLNGNFRADIVYWRNSDRPFGVVEVKRKWNADLCIADIRRLEALIDRCGSECSGTLQFACLAVFLARAKDPHGEKLAALYKHVREYLQSKCVRRFRYHTLSPHQYKYAGREEFSHYSAGGVIIEFY
jgi:hypothetical protein